MDPKILTSFLSPLVAIIVPFLVWYLNKREKNIIQQQIDAQISRFNLIDKMLSLSEKGKLDISFEEDIRYEVEQSREILNMDEEGYKEKENAKRRKYLASISKVRKFFLLYKPNGLQFFIFQIAFFYMIFSLTSGVISFITGYGSLYQELFDTIKNDPHDTFLIPYIGIIIHSIFISVFIVQLIFIYIFYRGACKYQFK